MFVLALPKTGVVSFYCWESCCMARHRFAVVVIGCIAWLAGSQLSRIQLDAAEVEPIEIAADGLAMVARSFA